MYVLTGEAALENQDVFKFVCILWLPTQQLPHPEKYGRKLCTNIRGYDLISFFHVAPLTEIEAIVSV